MTSHPKCCRCHRSLTGARLVIDGCWTCPDCAYELEQARAQGRPDPRPVRPVPSTRRRRAEPQRETLFPIAPYVRRDGA